MDFQFDLQNAMFSYGDFSFDGFSSTDKSMNRMEDSQVCVYGGEDLGEHGFYLQEKQQQQPFSPYDLLHDLPYQVVSPPIEASLEEITKFGEIPTGISVVEVKKDKKYPFSLAALELLNNYGSGLKRLKGDRVIMLSNIDGENCTEVAGRKFSTEEILRIAGEKFVQTSSQAASHPFEWSFSGLSIEETKDVQLVEWLLASAEKVGCQQYERAIRLLNQCNCLCSKTGNPVQRVVYYFCEALRNKIDRETGRLTSKGMRNEQFFDIDKAMMVPDAPKLAFHLGLPFSQIEKFAGIQAIIENVSGARRVHVIDLRLANGITAIGTTAKHLMEEIGKWLSSFAHTMNIPFSFKIVMVSEKLELHEDLFEIDDDETVAVYSSFFLRSMLSRPDQLETLMRGIKNISPCVMVVTEVEANHNSPVFVNRFIEALFFYGVLFDSFATSMNQDHENRMVVEGQYCFEAIKSIVAAEGEERKIRNVKIDVWRAFFARFGMEEAELSPSSLFQANQIPKNFSCGKYCTISMNEKCLLMGWKGTPLQSLSVWKFTQEL
ncbi:hypothetical protein UlMin_009658 [Ulmus minor]